MNKRSMLALATLTAALLLPLTAQALTVKSLVQVDRPVVTLGDVLEDAGAAAGFVVADAPAPGESASLSLYAVARAAEQAGLSAAGIGAGRITVERPGRPVPQALVEERIAAALAGAGVQGQQAVRLTGAYGSLYVPAAADPAGVHVENVRHDPRSGRFTVSLVTPLDAGRTTRHEISGIAEPQAEVPVLARAMGPGETIAASDLRWTMLPERQVNRTMITASSALVGMEPRRSLREGQPLRLTDVQRPQLVEKGQLATMIVAHGRLTLTAVGKAMTDGAMGDTVRLVNTATNRTVEGEVVGLGRVAVRTPGAVHAAR